MDCDDRYELFKLYFSYNTMSAIWFHKLNEVKSKFKDFMEGFWSKKRFLRLNFMILLKENY